MITKINIVGHCIVSSAIYVDGIEYSCREHFIRSTAGVVRGRVAELEVREFPSDVVLSPYRSVNRSFSLSSVVFNV